MDTCTRSNLAPKTSTHPRQGSIPFSATQPLRLCLQFQCYSGCGNKKNNPSRSICEVPSYTRFIKLVQTQFHSKLVQTKVKYAHTTNHNVNITKHASTHFMTEETIAQQHWGNQRWPVFLIKLSDLHYSFIHQIKETPNLCATEDGNNKRTTQNKTWFCKQDKHTACINRME